MSAYMKKRYRENIEKSRQLKREQYYRLKAIRLAAENIDELEPELEPEPEPDAEPSILQTSMVREVLPPKSYPLHGYKFLK